MTARERIAGLLDPGAFFLETGLLIAYDANTGAGDDTNLIPLTHHDFSVTATNNDVVLDPSDFFEAS